MADRGCCKTCTNFKGHGRDCLDDCIACYNPDHCESCKPCLQWRDKTADKPAEYNPIDNKFTHDLLHSAQEVRDLVLSQKDKRVSKSMTFNDFVKAIEAIETEQDKKWRLSACQHS